MGQSASAPAPPPKDGKMRRVVLVKVFILYPSPSPARSYLIRTYSFSPTPTWRKLSWKFKRSNTSLHSKPVASSRFHAPPIGGYPGPPKWRSPHQSHRGSCVFVSHFCHLPIQNRAIEISFFFLHASPGQPFRLRRVG